MLAFASADLQKTAVETLIVPVCMDKDIHTDRTIVATLKKVKQFKEFSGEKDQEIVIYNPSGLEANRVVFWGLGKLDEIDPETLRAMAGKAVKKCIQMKLEAVHFMVPTAQKIGMELPLLLEALMEGICLGNHRFDVYLEEKKQKPLNKAYLLVAAEVAKKYGSLPSRVEAICAGTALARDWVSMPPNEKRPEQFANLILSQARRMKLTARIMPESEMKRKGFGALLAVGAGSQSRPRMVVLEYKARGSRKTIALVGKGVTFDSGGINLKPSTSMDDMKMDMSGAAAVAATLITVAKLKPGINVIGAMPIVENMPSGSASRPGDIIKSYSGKSIEIGNTDAEGRLILVDAMAYVSRKYKPHTLIDLATLTGACVVALGEKIAGVFSEDDDLAEAIVASGKKTHERCWRMPLPPDYKEQLKSDFADISNMGSTRWGGAITAALFLSEFVKNIRWAHIDIAGPAYVKKENAYFSAGGTGFGVRLLCDLIDKLEKRAL
ncbi:MAG: leucyl aminopeptidase [Thermodesulfobacteriota bacterium]